MRRITDSLFFFLLSLTIPSPWWSLAAARRLLRAGGALGVWGRSWWRSPRGPAGKEGVKYSLRHNTLWLFSTLGINAVLPFTIHIYTQYNASMICSIYLFLVLSLDTLDDLGSPPGAWGLLRDPVDDAKAALSDLLVQGVLLVEHVPWLDLDVEGSEGLFIVWK